MKRLDVLAATLLIVGGLNWGLVAVARFDLVAWIFGEDFGGTTVGQPDRLRPGRPRGRLWDRLAVSRSARAPHTSAATRQRSPDERNQTCAISVSLCQSRQSSAVAAAGAAGPAAAGTAAPAKNQKDIVDTAVAAGTFNTLAKPARRQAGLVDTLERPGPFTVFAPTDAAFARLPKGEARGRSWRHPKRAEDRAALPRGIRTPRVGRRRQAEAPSEDAERQARSHPRRRTRRCL